MKLEIGKLEILRTIERYRGPANFQFLKIQFLKIPAKKGIFQKNNPTRRLPLAQTKKAEYRDNSEKGMPTK